MWFKWMALAFITNGLSQFGARILQSMGLAESHNYLYLAFWYTTGLFAAVAAFATKREKIERREILIGSAMGLFSSLGWLFFTLALGRGFPGYLGFPIAIGGSLSIVALVGVLIFRERLSHYGYAGIISGIAGLILLVTPWN